MKTWTRITLTIPVEHAPAANRLAALFDFDTGGADTFGLCGMSPTGEEPATHYTVGTQFNAVYLDGITDPVRVRTVLDALAEEYGRDPADQADIDAWCEHVIVGEPVGLTRIIQEDVV